MKKITLLLLFITSIISAQIFQNENFDALSIGDVGTDPTGATAGQGGMFTFNGGNSDYQIVDEGGTQANVLQITGPATDSGSRFLWVNGLNTFWGARTSGNDYIEIEFDFFTGPTTTSTNATAIQIYNSDYTIVIAGFQFSSQTKELSGTVYTDGGGSVPIGTYLIDLGPSNTTITLNADTWYRIGVAFNPVNGEVIWRGPGFYTGFPSSATGINPFEVDFAVFAGTGNSVASVAKFDAIRIEATAAENLLLSINDTDNTLSESIKLYPNPVNDVINLTAANRLNLTKLEIIDINGRTVKSISIENITRREINISELSKGLYLINIHSKDGMVTKKIIKQ